MTTPAVDYQLVRGLQERVADAMTQETQAREQSGGRALTRADEQQRALSLIRAQVSAHMHAQLAAGVELPDAEHDRRLIDAVYAAIYGAGELQSLLDDNAIENIDLNGCDEVWITYADERGKQRGRPVAATDEDLVAIVQNLAAYAGLNARPFTAAHPELDLRLPDGSRLSALMVACERPAVSIRRNRFPQMFLSDLVELGTVDEELARFLRAAVLARCNLVVAGATDAGKTTLLRALINCIPPGERLVTVERALELGLRRHPELHPDVLELEEVLPDAEGRGGVAIDALVRRSRRANPSRVIVGEVLGPEVVEMLSAMAQGNDGSLSTIHARDAAEVFSRIATYAAQHESLDFAVTHSLIAGAVDFVVFVKKNDLAGGRRTVTEVLEVTGCSDGRVTRSVIFGPSLAHGRAERRTEVAITRSKELAGYGYDDIDGGWADEGAAW